MLDYHALQILSWVALGAVMVIFCLTGGFDLGVGAILPLITKKDTERRVMINIIGPTWDGNQVWLVIIGAGIFAIWPRAYATSFTGFYFAMLITLWSLFLRPVSFEYRSKLNSNCWKTFWDWALFVGSVVPSWVFGTAMGNLLVGSAFHYGETDLQLLYTGSFLDLLNPFSIMCGILSLLLFMMHGACYLVLRSQGVILKRARKVARWSSLAFFLLYLGIGFWLTYALPGYRLLTLPKNILHAEVIRYTGAWMFNYYHFPILLIAPLTGLIGALSVAYLSEKKRLSCFAASSFCTIGTVSSIGFSLFPFLIPSSSHPEQSLLIWNSASSMLSLQGILLIAGIMLPIIFIYTNFVYRKLWGREPYLSEKTIKEKTHIFY